MSRRIEIRVDDDLYDQILKHAEAQDRTVNWIAGRALADYCAVATQAGIEEARRSPGEPYVGKSRGEARFEESKIRGARHAVKVVDEVRGPQVAPDFKGGKR